MKYTISTQNSTNKTRNVFLMLFLTAFCSFAFAGSASAINYTIEYKENVATNMPESVLGGLSPSASALISNNSPLRAGFRFIGWCDQATTKSEDTDTCASGHQHQPGGTVTLDATDNANNIKLYAMWGPAPKTIATASTMQEVAECPSTLTTGQVYTIEDSRDNQDYRVAKLADGKCWMVENLNLAGGTALSADDTDITGAYISRFTSSNNLTKTSDTIVLPASSTSGFSTANYSYVYNSGNKTSNCSNQGCYSYYSWDAATLGSARSISTENTDAPQSICPKGWKLPTSGSDSNDGWKRGDFYALASAYGANLESNHYENSASFYNNAGPGTTPDFLLAGYYGDGSFYYGSSGGYWSSTSLSTTSDALNLSFDNSYVNSAYDLSRRLGYSVRCVFDDSVYMQDLNSDTIAELLPNIGDSAKVKDRRDKQEYTIAKLADGKYWMTENLNLAGATALSADDTDVNASYISSFSQGNNWVKSGNTIVLPNSSRNYFNSANKAFVYNSGNKENCGAVDQYLECYSYYSWDAATLGSGRSISTDNTDAPYSICPKGWRLPKTRTTSGANWSTVSDFYVLAHEYGLDSTTSTSENDWDFYNNAGPGTIPNFLLAGYMTYNVTNDPGYYGAYWSSTSYSSTSDARYLALSLRSENIISADEWGRSHGFSVRCLFGS